MPKAAEKIRNNFFGGFEGAVSITSVIVIPLCKFVQVNVSSRRAFEGAFLEPVGFPTAYVCSSLPIRALSRRPGTLALRSEITGDLVSPLLCASVGLVDVLLHDYLKFL